MTGVCLISSRYKVWPSLQRLIIDIGNYDVHKFHRYLLSLSLSLSLSFSLSLSHSLSHIAQVFTVFMLINIRSN